jgi:predicted nuclease of predicted toxin-antitoxin system
MKLKLDENLPLRLASVLTSLGHDVHTAPQEGLAGAMDLRIWESAQLESRFFVTQDMDFSDLRKFAPGTHSGILIVRLHTPSWKRLVGRMAEVFQIENVSTWSGCFVVATEAKIRVVRP